MNQPPPTETQTGKRIVSKGEYVCKMGLNLWGLCMYFAKPCCTIVAFYLSIYLLTVLICHFFLGVEMANIQSVPLIALGILVGALGSVYLKPFAHVLMSIDPGTPLTHANTAALPAPDSLVRASAEPVQEQEAVLLRAATETQERHEEQLVRASAGGTNG